jgi:hypothetical protein
MTLHIEFPRSHMLPSPLVPRDPPGERVMRLRKSWHNQSSKAARPSKARSSPSTLRREGEVFSFNLQITIPH